MKENGSELDRLRGAFDSLNSSTEKLMSAYETLQRETARISVDLEESRDFFKDTLNSLTSAVVVTSLESEIILSNPQARRLGVADARLTDEWLKEIEPFTAYDPDGKRKIETNGPEGRTLAVSVSPFRRKGTPLAGYIFVIDDVTELMRLRKQARRSERMTLLGEMAAGMAHEIRNPLGGMEIFTSLLRRELAEDEEKLKMLGHITAGITTIENVVSNFLMFTTRPKPARNELDIKKLIENILEFASHVFERSGISVRTDLPEGPLAVKADGELLRQALLNMIQNSVQAMPEGGVFELSLKKKSVPGSPDKAEIILKDTGPGIPRDVRDRIFDPFFTTRESGAGLGLAIVSQITQAHGGYVDALDSPGGGAAFIISLPVEEA